jgi:TRAP-type C4-dicarboxylate transport system permease small subunit
MDPHRFIAHWQEWVTLSGYIGLSLFVAWQVFTRSGPKA